MSHDDVEIVRRVLASWATGDFVENADLFDPEIVLETFMPDTRDLVTRGTAQLENFTREWLAQWRAYRIVAEEFREVPPDKVFATVRQIGRGRHSDVEAASPGFTVWTLRQGRIVRLSLHYDRDDALEAAGLTG